MSDKKKQSLYEKLTDYAVSGIYPFCMPGHKRQASFPKDEQGRPVDPYQIDITEVEGFDDLHRPAGILKDITERAAEIYTDHGIRPSVFMSVNGSTACNLAAVNAVPEGPLLIAANCHRSVFNGAKVSGRQVIELAPEWISAYSVYGGVSPEAVENALKGYPAIKAVVVTSPSYEGFLSDIRRIAKIVHAHGAFLIVDEAHGAHLPFCGSMPSSALYEGADIVIHSLHKTVGSLNQTALGFVNAPELVDSFHEKLLWFTTTSPSYILMASIEQAVEWADRNRQRFDAYFEKLMLLRNRLSGLPGGRLGIVDKSIAGSYNIFDLDPCKLMFYAKGISGEELYRRFYEKYHLQFEKYGDRYALAMTTVWDTDEGYERLYQAAEAVNASLLEQ